MVTTFSSFSIVSTGSVNEAVLMSLVVLHSEWSVINDASNYLVNEASLQTTEPRSQQFLAAAADTVSTVLDGHCLVLGFRASIQVGSIFPFYMNLVTHRPAGLCDQ